MSADNELEHLRAEVERLHSWAGLLSLLDEHWPEDIFPTEPDSETRDPGPRIVSLLRWVERLRAERDALKATEQQIREKAAEEILADVAALFAAHVGADLWEAAYRAAWVARGKS